MAAPASNKPHGGAQRKLQGRARDALVFAASFAVAVLALLAPASVLSPPWRGQPAVPPRIPGPADGPRTFYDDPELSYDAVAGRRITGWDAKRAAWLRSRGLAGGRSTPERVVMVSGSQPDPCPGEAGDHLMLRFLKNKLDYCRLHGIELLYNRDFLHPAMTYVWAKIPIVRAAMLAHPEAEWIWWVDSDAAFTDMDFFPPLATKYSHHNLIVHGDIERFFGNRSWLGINTGVFLIRNCQWSLDLMDQWVRMGPAYPEHDHWGHVVMESLAEKGSPWCDDQSALAYLLLNDWERLGKKVYIETEYYLHGYWVDIMGRLDGGVAARYEDVERRTPALRRRHAERERARYAEARNAAVGGGAVPGPAGGGKWGWRRPFVTHFVGCQPCGGGRNPMYSKESCDGGMRRALDFADDQVLRAYGFRHGAPLDGSIVPLPFDYPAEPARNR
ncbi:unnamed protein product [Urochloa humidicola]